jgi:peptidoglycan/LPS O-acetylase OafA/YrhL
MGKLADRHNNFDFLRLLFASLVIVSHSYFLTGKTDPLAWATHNQVSFGALAVDVFFIMSGYLILTSVIFSHSLQSYLWKRLLRLFPGLFILLVFSLLLLLLAYTGDNIFCESSFWTYLPNNLSLYRVQYYVAHVFENNPYSKVINGSLWSLSYEFTMYLFIGALFPLRNSKLLLPLLLVCFASAMLLFNLKPSFLSNVFGLLCLDSAQAYRLATYFLSGSLLTFVDWDKINRTSIKWLLLAVLLLSIWLQAYKFISPLVLPFLVIANGLSFSKILDYIPNKWGDISYGVYIYGFLVQQTLLNYLSLHPFILIILSLSITYVLSYLSWHYVEKKCLKYKSII